MNKLWRLFSSFQLKSQIPFHLNINDTYASEEFRIWLSKLPEVCESISDEQWLHRGRNDVFWIKFGGEKLVVKRFYNRGWYKRILYRLKSGKAQRSYIYSKKLLEAGFNSPTPIAWVEFKEDGWLKESFYVSQFLDFEHDGQKLKSSSSQSNLNRVCSIGKTVGEMHNSGINHLDLNGGNLLFRRSSKQDFEIFFVDNNRIRFKKFTPEKGVGILLTTGFEGEHLYALLCGYAKRRKISTTTAFKMYKRKYFFYLTKHSFKNATRAWRKKIGL